MGMLMRIDGSESVYCLRATAWTLADFVDPEVDVDAVYGSLSQLAEDGEVERVREHQAVGDVSWRLAGGE